MGLHDDQASPDRWSLGGYCGGQAGFGAPQRYGEVPAGVRGQRHEGVGEGCDGQRLRRLQASWIAL